MIDFTLTENDQAAVDYARTQALLCRKYARYYDENEHEMAPEELPEAEAFFAENEMPAAPGPEDTSPPVMLGLHSMISHWGDYTIRLRRNGGGLGNAALSAAGTPEQQAKWGNLVLAMAITEPGCGSDPSRVSCTAVLDEATDEWVVNGEKIFVTTGIRAEGVVVWATLDKSAGRAGIKSFLIEKGAPGFEVPHKEKKLGIRADDTAAYVFRDCRIPRGNLLGGDESISTKTSGGFRGVMKTFNMTRPTVAAMGLGLAEAALDFTRDQLLARGIDIDYSEGLDSQCAAAEKFIRLEACFEASKLTTLQCLYLVSQRHPGLYRDTRAHGDLAGAPHREVDAGLPHHRYLRGHGRDPATHHCPGVARLHAGRSQVGTR